MTTTSASLRIDGGSATFLRAALFRQGPPADNLGARVVHARNANGARIAQSGLASIVKIPWGAT